MDEQHQPATYKQKIEFLLTIIELEEKRRESVENRFSVLIASNAILLSVIIGWGIPSIISENTIYWIQVILTAMALGSVLLSTFWCAQILLPLRSQKQRAKIMDLGSYPEIEYNLILFTRISKYKKANYLKEINLLTQNQILDQLTLQVHNVARLLNYRYHVLELAHKSFMVGIVLFALLALIKIFVG